MDVSPLASSFTHSCQLITQIYAKWRKNNRTGDDNNDIDERREIKVSSKYLHSSSCCGCQRDANIVATPEALLNHSINSRWFVPITHRHRSRCRRGAGTFHGSAQSTILIKYSSRDACHISSHSRSSSNGGFALCPILRFWILASAMACEIRKPKRRRALQLSAFFRLISGIDFWCVFNDVWVDFVSQTNDLNLIERARMERTCFDARYSCVHIKNLFCFPHSSYRTLLWAFPPAAVNSNVQFWDSPQSKAHLLSGAWKQHGKFISNLQFTVSNMFAVPIRKGVEIHFNWPAG